MSGEQPTVPMGSNNASNSGKTDIDIKTNIKTTEVTVAGDTVDLDKDIEGPQSADIIDQDPFGLLSTMEQLDIAEAGEDPFIEPNSEVSIL